MAQAHGPTSLRALHPTRAWIVPAGMLASAGLLLAGLILPLMYTERLVLWKSEYSVWTGVVELCKQNELMLAGILFFFSMVFPILKLSMLAAIWFRPLPPADRITLLHWLGILGKWSMLDVFVVAILIVLVKLGPLARVEPRAGVYVFAAAIAASMLTTMHVDRLARRAPRR